MNRDIDTVRTPRTFHPIEIRSDNRCIEYVLARLCRHKLVPDAIGMISGYILQRSFFVNLRNLEAVRYQRVGDIKIAERVEADITDADFHDAPLANVIYQGFWYGYSDLLQTHIRAYEITPAHTDLVIADRLCNPQLRVGAG